MPSHASAVVTDTFEDQQDQRPCHLLTDAPTELEEGEIKVLVAEGQCIQSHLPTTDTRMTPEAVSRAFSKMMFLGNVHGALNFLSRNTSGLPLKLEDVIQTKEGTTESVLNILESLHPEGKPLVNEALLSSTLPNALPADPVIFEAIDGSMIKSTALHCKGSAGPSGVDARAWRRMCSSFKETSTSLCDAIAGVAKRICTQPVSSSGLSALLACHLVPLNKNPGVCPIGVGEVTRHCLQSPNKSSEERYHVGSWTTPGMLWYWEWLRGSCSCHEGGF